MDFRPKAMTMKKTLFTLAAILLLPLPAAAQDSDLDPTRGQA